MLEFVAARTAYRRIFDSVMDAGQSDEGWFGCWGDSAAG